MCIRTLLITSHKRREAENKTCSNTNRGCTVELTYNNILFSNVLDVVMNSSCTVNVFCVW